MTSCLYLFMSKSWVGKWCLFHAFPIWELHLRLEGPWKNDMFFSLKSTWVYNLCTKLGQSWGKGKSRSVPLPNNLKFSILECLESCLQIQPFWLEHVEQTVEQLPPSRFTSEKCLRWDFIQVCCLNSNWMKIASLPNQLQHEYKLIIWQSFYALRRYMMFFLSLSLVVGIYSSLALPITVSQSSISKRFLSKVKANLLQVCYSANSLRPVSRDRSSPLAKLAYLMTFIVA